MNYYALYPDELYHYGTKGMHWGIRQYQNSDGTLTALGRIHYGVKGFYDGPQMDRVRSSIKRGWYTANDPEFLGRKMNQLKASAGRANAIMNDPEFWKQDVTKVRNFVDNYFGPKKIDRHDDDRYHDLSTANQYGVSYDNQKQNANFGSSTSFEFGQGSTSRGYSDIGTALLSVFDSYETAKNVTFSDLAKFGLTEEVLGDYSEGNSVKAKNVRVTLDSPDIIQVQPGDNKYGFESGKRTWDIVKGATVDTQPISEQNQRRRSTEQLYQDTIRKQRDNFYEQTSKMAPDSYKTGYDVGMVEAQKSKNDWMKANKGATEADFNKVAEQWATARGNQFVDEFMKEARRVSAMDAIERDIDSSGQRMANIDIDSMNALARANTKVAELQKKQRDKYRDIAKVANNYKEWQLYGN